jgi:hypothetical protein
MEGFRKIKKSFALSRVLNKISHADLADCADFLDVVDLLNPEGFK